MGHEHVIRLYGASSIPRRSGHLSCAKTYDEAPAETLSDASEGARWPLGTREILFGTDGRRLAGTSRHEMLHEQTRRGRQTARITDDDFEGSARPIVGDRNGYEIHAGSHDIKRTIWDQRDPKPALDHAADCVETRNMNAESHLASGLCCRDSRPSIDRAVGVKTDVIEVERIDKTNSATSGEGVISAHRQDQPVRSVRVSRQGTAVDRSDADADFPETLLHPLHNCVAHTFIQIDFHAAVFRHEARQVVRQELNDGRYIREHTDVSAHSLGMFAKFLTHSRDALEHGPCMVQKGLSSRGEAHALRMSDEEHCFESLLEICQALAQGARRDEFALGGPGQGALFADGDEELERYEIHSADKIWLRHATWLSRRSSFDMDERPPWCRQSNC